MALALLCVLAAREPLLHETFEDGALAPGAWDARIEPIAKRHIDPTMHGPRLAGFNSLGCGYLHFWSPNRGEVWDHPPEDGTGAWPTVLVNATNITGLIRPDETRVLRMAVRGNRVSCFRDDLLVGTAPTRALRGTRAGLEMAAGGNPACRWLDFTVRAFR